MPDYQMVCGNEKWFNKFVNELLAQGYELYGPPMTTSTKGSDGETYLAFSQALLKP